LHESTNQELFDARTDVIACLDRTLTVLRTYLLKFSRGTNFDREAATLTAVMTTYRGLLDSVNE
jgi:hypothetical protein